MAFGNLTVDFKQLSKIPVRDRVALARSPKASEIFGDMSPSEIAALFPDYYKKFMPKAGSTTSMTAGMTGAGFTGTGTGTSTATSTSTTSSTATISTSYMDEILSGAGIGAGTSKLSAGSRGNLGYAQTLKLSPRKKALLDAIATDSGGGYGTINYLGAKFIGNETTDFSQHPFQDPSKRGLTKYRASGRYQITLTNYEKFAKQLGLHDYETGKSDFSFEAQDLIAFEMAKDVYRVGTGGRNLEEDINNPNISPEQLIRPLSIDYGWHILKKQSGMNNAINVFKNNLPTYEQELLETQTATLPDTQPQTGEASQGTDVNIENLAGTPASQNTAAVVSQTTTFDPNIFSQLDPRIKEEYIKASDSKKKRIETAITKLGVSGVQKIMEKYPQKTASAVTDTTVQESNKKFTEASSASGFYDGLRKSYPEKIDINSEIWNQVDPVLAAARKQIVDAETGLVGRDALLAADSASKVLRTNNYTPRVASGGDNHSKNHGSGRDANYSIDLAASVVNEQGKLVPVQLGKGMPEKIKNDMATAAYFATMGAEGGHRIGYPDDSSPHSMHIQQDPIRPDAFWGYSEIAKRKGIDSSTKAALTATTEGKRFLQERETIARLSPEEKAAYFDSITGFEAKKAAIVAADISKTIPDSTPQTQPSQIDPKTGSDVTVTNMEGSPATANTAPAMKLGGDLNFKEPNTVKESMSLIADGKKVADFNKDEAVNIEDGKMSVENAFKKTAKETQQKTDKGMLKSDNQFTLRQSTTDTPKPYGEQSKYGIVPESPSIVRQTQMAQFGGYNHFSRRSHSS